MNLQDKATESQIVQAFHDFKMAVALNDFKQADESREIYFNLIRQRTSAVIAELESRLENA